MTLSQDNGSELIKISLNPTPLLSIYCKCTTKTYNNRTTATKSSFVGTNSSIEMMKKFSRTNIATCGALPEEMRRKLREKKTFLTGSTYKGSWDPLGMSGYGVYTFPNSEVIYMGNFEDGMFHGEGKLHYENGAVLKGRWHKGKLMEKTLFFGDGLEYKETDWGYCQYPDRRYTEEIDYGIEPAGNSYITPQMPPREIPPGCYDTGDGIYQPKLKSVTAYGDPKKIVRMVNQREHEWITTNCRYSPERPVGHAAFLYEEWEVPTLAAPDMPPPPSSTSMTRKAAAEQTCWLNEEAGFTPHTEPSAHAQFSYP